MNKNVTKNVTKILWFFLLFVAAANFLISPSANAFDVYLFGVPIKKMDKIKWKPFLLGAASSALIHTIGHIATMEYYDVDYDIKISILEISETVKGATPHQARRIARAGFFAQHLSTMILRSFEKTKKTSFTKGFATMSFLETALYPVIYRNSGDLEVINRHGGEWYMNYMVFSMIGFVNLIRIEW